MSIAAAGPFIYKLLDGVTTGSSQPINVIGLSDLTVYVIGAGTVDAGAITLETAAWLPDNEIPFGGTWDECAGGAITIVSGTMVAKRATLDSSTGSLALAWVRARVSTNVTGTAGRVSVYLVGA